MAGEKQPNYSYQPKGFWTEKNEHGELVYCHKTRQRGETFIIRKTLRELAEILNKKVETQKA